ncbi:uncharacterized protein LOC108427329 [Pygocentrus nattereri]|uniref:uncharacterized protein LOC108427329 n=1 Tax=Pygocentrus nattereri TaxID=42514 RepID=UPI00081459AD|nr:uncharacterized protein LOC108427329 [Pygocentrus nattereri]
MGAMSAEMACFLKDATQSQTELMMKISELYPFITSSYVTYMSLLGATLSSVAGVAGGCQAYNVVKRQRWEDISGKALALAASVAVLGVGVTGAALGAILEIFFSNFMLNVFSVNSGVTFMLWHTLASTIISLFLCAFSGFFYGCISVFVSFMICLLIYSERLMAILFFGTEFIFFLDLGSMLPLILPSLLLCLFQKFHLSKKAVGIPSIMVTTVLIARSYFHDKDQPVPSLDPAEFTIPALLVLERFFVLVLGVQMFQASCGAVLFSYFVTEGEGDVCTGAVAATVGVLTFLMKTSNMLGTGASLGGLLAASGGAGVALNAAGDLGQRYGGLAGRSGAVIGGAVGAFLALGTQNLKFGIMVSLCAAAIPGSPYILFV